MYPWESLPIAQQAASERGRQLNISTSQTRQYSLPAHSEAMLINNHRPPEPDLEAELAMDKMQCAQDSGVKVSSNEFETSRRSNDLTPASAFRKRRTALSLSSVHNAHLNGMQGTFAALKRAAQQAGSAAMFVKVSCKRVTIPMY